MTDLTHLDSTALKNFKNNDVADFRKNLKDIREDTPGGIRSLKNLAADRGEDSVGGGSAALRLGLMSGGSNTDPVGGGALLTALKKQATGQDDIFVAQGTLFEDIDSALEETITTLLKNQGDSLTSIDGEKLMDIFGTVDDDMSGTGGDDDS
ncbi:type VII secretion system-associated protein [Streptomyces sp. NBC_00670]|jgi:hypothetical protein|uniref:type VII secretion system-associated protein n=1 Tax=Streptomyces sp. NBC_00670 TaxID=2975804 RepID=UPI002E342890|nr:type VII secretion system-associated protein [Streptomyces sp. NBC_00670]